MWMSPGCQYVFLAWVQTRDSTHSTEWTWLSRSDIALWNSGSLGWKNDYPVSTRRSWPWAGQSCLLRSALSLIWVFENPGFSLHVEKKPPPVCLYRCFMQLYRLKTSVVGSEKQEVPTCVLLFTHGDNVMWFQAKKCVFVSFQDAWWVRVSITTQYNNIYDII